MKGLVLAHCVLEMREGRMTIGTLSLMLSYIDMLLSPLEWLSGVSDIFNRLGKRISKSLDYLIISNPVTSQLPPDALIELPPLQTSVKFDQISFSYNESAQALHSTTFELPRGKTTALVGRSGAGKSTITSILLRLYEPDSGTVFWDGIDISKTEISAIRKAVAFVPRDPGLFNRTIAENIAYGKPNATTSEIEQAARDSYAHEFIMATPDGYQSVIGERGIKLSGGQRQRIAIARALLLDPSVLILDESTSQLDSESEKAIQTYIDASHPNRAQLIIAHRLSTVRHAHNIIVLDEGTVVAQGSYEELLNTCKIFQNFHNLQAKALIH